MDFLKSSLLPLFAANIIALPHLQDTLSTHDQEIIPKRPCPCDEKQAPLSREEIASKVAKVQAQAFRSPNGGGGATPACTAVVTSQCSLQLWTWYQCLRTSQQGVSPAVCQLWTHPVNVWYCPGDTYYQCFGTWTASSSPCSAAQTTCGPNTTAVLPAGCVPPVDITWKNCQ